MAVITVTDERYTVISADMHAGNHVLGYRPYLEKTWREEFDSWAATAKGRWNAPDRPEEADEDIRGRWDSDLRVEVMERDGICAELFFPDTMPPFFPSGAAFANQPRDRASYERRLAGIRAHNRWAVDFCAELSGRRKSPVQIFLFDVDDALEDIRWGYEHGMPAVLVPGIAPNHPLEGLWSRRYEPIWQLCQELGMPVNQHIGAGTPDLSLESADGAALIYEVQFYARRSLWHMIFGGVFERYPELKFVMTEEGLAWTLPELARLDHYFANVTAHPSLAQSTFGYESLRQLSMPPSGYFHRNCWIGATSLPPSELGALSFVSADRVMWGADYPHPEGTVPHTLAALRATFSSMPAPQCRKILSETAAALYGFDLDALAPIAQRVGPATRDVHTPLDAYPEGSRFSIYLGPLRPEAGELSGFSGQVQAVV